MTVHVVLGSNGVVGRETIAALRARDHDVRAVSRTPSAAPVPGVTHLAADLRDAASAARALEGADVAYLTVGLPYSTRVWRRDWPVIVQNVVDGCLARTAPVGHRVLRSLEGVGDRSAGVERREYPLRGGDRQAARVDEGSHESHALHVRLVVVGLIAAQALTLVDQSLAQVVLQRGDRSAAPSAEL